MNVSDCECSSGCESGWTLYLEEQSFYSPNNASHGLCNNKAFAMEENGNEEEEEEEDLSMVSDASSGPPHINEEFEEEEDEEQEAMLHFNNVNKPCFFNTKKTTFIKSGKRQKMKQQLQQQQFSNHDDQDDTASSPLLGLSNMQDFIGLTNNTNNQGSVESVLNYSQGYSATHFQRKIPALQKPFGFLQSSVSRNQPHEINDMKGIRGWN